MIDANIEVHSVMKNDSMSGHWITPLEKVIVELNKVKKIQNILEKNHFYKVIYSNRE